MNEPETEEKYNPLRKSYRDFPVRFTNENTDIFFKIGHICDISRLFADNKVIIPGYNKWLYFDIGDFTFPKETVFTYMNDYLIYIITNERRGLNIILKHLYNFIVKYTKVSLFTDDEVEKLTKILKNLTFEAFRREFQLNSQDQLFIIAIWCYVRKVNSAAIKKK